MTTAISSNKVAHRSGSKVKRPGGFELIKRVHIYWQSIRRGQHLLSSSYRNQPIARGIPMRVWNRHSALFMLMSEHTDDY